MISDMRLIISTEKSHGLRAMSANTGSVKSGDFGYRFCRSFEDKEGKNEKQFEKDIELFNNDHSCYGRDTRHHACWC